MQKLSEAILTDAVLGFCTYNPELIGKASCVSKRWNNAGNNQKLWEKICKRVLGESISSFQGSWKKRFNIYQNWNKGLFQQNEVKLENKYFIPRSLTKGAFHINHLSEDSIEVIDWITQKITTLYSPGAFVKNYYEINKNGFQINNDNSRFIVVKTLGKNLTVFEKNTGQLMYSIPALSEYDILGNLACNEKYVASYDNDGGRLTFSVWEVEGLKLIWTNKLMNNGLCRRAKIFYFQGNDLIWLWGSPKRGFILEQVDVINRKFIRRPKGIGCLDRRDIVIGQNAFYVRPLFKFHEYDFSVFHVDKPDATEFVQNNYSFSTLDQTSSLLDKSYKEAHAWAYLSRNFYFTCDYYFKQDFKRSVIKVWNIQTKKLAFEKCLEGILVKKMIGDETRLFLTDNHSRIIEWNVGLADKKNLQKFLKTPQPTPKEGEGIQKELVKTQADIAGSQESQNKLPEKTLSRFKLFLIKIEEIIKKIFQMIRKIFTVNAKKV